MIGAQTIRDAIARLLPEDEDAIVRAEVHTGIDATDDEAVWVYVIVRDADIERFWERWDDLRDRIRETVRETSGRPYVYIRMRAASEADELSQ